ncbi:MAG: hypothetical protein ABI643_00265 [Candidatus Doudnabacteria bacterium]
MVLFAILLVLAFASARHVFLIMLAPVEILCYLFDIEGPIEAIRRRLNTTMFFLSKYARIFGFS